jgi:hypothetical protein
MIKQLKYLRSCLRRLPQYGSTCFRTDQRNNTTEMMQQLKHQGIIENLTMQNSRSLKATKKITVKGEFIVNIEDSIIGANGQR